jgi:hypothetical protein
MKAKDLAALAALGVAGYAAYNKFGKKSPANSGAKAGAKLGDGERDSEAGESEARMNMRDINEGSGRRDAGGNTETRSRQERDVPEKIVSRQERDVPDRIMGRDAAGSRFTDKDVSAKKSAEATPAVAVKPVAVAKAPEAKRPIGVNAAGSRFTEKDAAPSEKQFTLPGTQSAMGDFSKAMLPEQRIAAIDAKSGASSASAKKTEALAALSKAEQAKDLEKKKANGTFVPIPQNVKPAATSTSKPPAAAAPAPPLSAAAAARQRAIDEKNFDSELMKGRRKAVVDTVKNIPANVSNAFKPLTKQEIIDQKNYDSQLMRDRREAAFGSVKNLFGFKKGGAVKKMASGGLASSRMSSKPSTASSRGDGIAQRGKTRGKMC